MLQVLLSKLAWEPLLWALASQRDHLCRDGWSVRDLRAALISADFESCGGLFRVANMPKVSPGSPAGTGDGTPPAAAPGAHLAPAWGSHGRLRFADLLSICWLGGSAICPLGLVANAAAGLPDQAASAVSSAPAEAAPPLQQPEQAQAGEALHGADTSGAQPPSDLPVSKA